MNQSELDEISTKITDFVIQFGDGIYNVTDYPYIKQYILVHINYGTIMVMKDNEEIIAACRWNQPDATHANILDFVVHPDYRNKFIAKEMFSRAKQAMPMLKTFSFERGKKYPNRPMKVYSIDRWIKEKKWAEVQNLQ